MTKAFEPPAVGSRFPATVVEATQRLVDAQELLRQAAERARQEAARQRDDGLQLLSDQIDEERAELRDEFVGESRKLRSSLHQAVSGLTTRASSNPEALAVAEYVNLGSAAMQDRLPDGDAAPVIPTLVPLLDHGNVVVSGTWSETVAALVQSMAYQALAGTAPGQLRVRSIDPRVRSALAVFSPLASVNEDLLVRPAGAEGEIEDLLHDLLGDVRATVDMFQGRKTSLGQMRRETGQPIGTYQLLVVADFPVAFSDRAVSSLVNLMREGPSTGISTIVHTYPVRTGAGDAHRRAKSIARLAKVVTVGDGTATAGWLPGWTTDPRSEPDLAESAFELAERARGAEAPQIDFLGCQPDVPLMSDSSAQRLVATIGLAGHRPVTITLGDEVDQRHNILVSGAVGQGKSNVLMVLIHSLAMRYPPSELEMHLLDFKEGVTLEPLGTTGSTPPSWLPHATTIGLNSDRTYGAAVLAHLVAEFERRAAIMRSHGDNITKYRLADPAHKMPRILVVIDEFQVLFDADDDVTDRALADLERLARKGRAYGIHLVLASQTLSGITSMLTKQDGIFAQFPVRLALKNSAGESRAVLDQDNTAAARLRYRGELLVNLDFGDVEANRRATAALAAEPQLAELRARICAHLEPTSLPSPAIFDGAHAPPLREAVPALRLLRDRSLHPTSARTALLGTAVDVGAQPVGFSLTDENGRHLAVVGAGAPRNAGSGSDANVNQAVGALQAAAISLAVQHPPGSARVIVLDLMPQQLSSDASVTAFVSLLSTAGAHTEHRRDGDVADFLLRLPELIGDRQPGDPPLYVVAFGLDRARRFRHVDFTTGATATPADGLHALLRDGPPVGAHLLAWWSSVRVMNEHLGLEASGTVDGLLSLRITGSDVQDLFGPFVVWKPEGPRGLFHDRTESADPAVIVPFAPLHVNDVSTIRAAIAR